MPPRKHCMTLATCSTRKQQILEQHRWKDWFAAGPSCSCWTAHHGVRCHVGQPAAASWDSRALFTASVTPFLRFTVNSKKAGATALLAQSECILPNKGNPHPRFKNEGEKIVERLVVVRVANAVSGNFASESWCCSVCVMSIDFEFLLVYPFSTVTLRVIMCHRLILNPNVCRRVSKCFTPNVCCVICD